VLSQLKFGVPKQMEAILPGVLHVWNAQDALTQIQVTPPKEKGIS